MCRLCSRGWWREVAGCGGTPAGPACRSRGRSTTASARSRSSPAGWDPPVPSSWSSPAQWNSARPPHVTGGPPSSQLLNSKQFVCQTHPPLGLLPVRPGGAAAAAGAPAGQAGLGVEARRAAGRGVPAEPVRSGGKQGTGHYHQGEFTNDLPIPPRNRTSDKCEWYWMAA